MITREEYIAGKVSHQDYYKSLADACGIGGFDKDFLFKVKKALDEDDFHLHSIPLHLWGNMCLRDMKNPHFDKVFKERGESNSLSTGVCMRKAKARFEALNAFFG